MELNSYFKNLISDIEPDNKAVSKAKKSHEELRETLKTNDEISKAYSDTYLSGSYARDTAIKYIKDVDVILLINLNHTTTPPDVVIAWLQQSLDKYYSSITPQGRSVSVKTDNGFALDIVPSVAIRDTSGPILIPDRDVKRWVASHPKGQIEFGIEKNKMTNGYYKPLVKLIKFWRDRFVSENAKVKSYILENLIGGNLKTEPSDYASGFVSILQNIYNEYSAYLSTRIVPQIPDLGYPSVNVAKRWKFDEFVAFLAEVKQGYNVASEALLSQDETESVKLWRKLFGNRFAV